MSELTTEYLNSREALRKDMEMLRSQIAMYLKCGQADLQAQGLLERASTLLRKAGSELREP